jgi:hypothetical protein
MTRTADKVRTELIGAETELARASRAEDNYDGNNPGKLTRLQKARQEAQQAVQSLKAELERLQ